jgi:2'-5' RNA ligase
MRLFIATFLNSRLISGNYNIFKKEASQIIGGKWVEGENLHFTYHFMGSVEDEKVPELKEKLTPFLTLYDEKLNIHTLKLNPSRNKPKILVSGVFNPTKKIVLIQKDMKKILKDCKVKFELRKFNPHMTLVRIKNTTPELPDFLEKNAKYSFGYMKGFSIELVQSTLTNERPIYSVL